MAGNTETLLEILRNLQARVRALESRNTSQALVVNDTGVELDHGDIVILSDDMDRAVEIHAGAVPEIGAGSVPETREIIAGDGLTGGGQLTADVTVDMGTPGTLTPLTINEATADSHTHEIDGYPHTAGADIDITGDVVARAGQGILLFSGAGALLAEYAFTALGLTAALAAAAAGDRVELPTGTVTQDATVPAGVVLCGTSREGSIVDGTLTVGVASVLQNLTVLRQVNQVGALVGVVGGAATTARLVNVRVIVENTLGPAHAVSMTLGGTIHAYETELLAMIGLNGYAVYTSDGFFTHYSGRAVGTDDCNPYWLEV